MMRLLLLIFTVYVALASACMFPFSNPRLSNQTLIREYLNNKTSNGALGWVSIVADQGGHKPWPWNPNTRNTFIPYCYLFPSHRQTLKKYFDAGWKLWYNKLGDAKEGGEHNFAGFQELMNGNGPISCLDENANWDATNVPADTLVVAYPGPDTFSQSTIGYYSADVKSEEGRHWTYLTLYPSQTDEYNILEVAHELGHVMGLVHEHQRTDRDEYVFYNCEALEGFREMIEQYIKEPGKYPPLKDICSGVAGANLFDPPFFAPGEYCTDMGYTNGRFNDQRSSAAYDHLSLMQYPSWAYRRVDGVGGVKASPLVRWKNGRPADGSPPNDQNAELCHDATEVSAGDAQGIKFLYP